MSFSVTLCGGFRSVEAVLADRVLATEAAPSRGYVHVNDMRVMHVVLTELGADDLDALIAEAGFDPHIINGHTRLIPFTAIGRLIAPAAERTECSHLGLLIGERVMLALQRVFGALLHNWDTVGDALRTLEAHLCVQDRGGVAGLGVFGAIAVLSYTPFEPDVIGAALHSGQALAKATNVLRAL